LRRLIVLAALLLAAIAAPDTLAATPREGQVTFHFDLWPWSSSRPIVVLVGRGVAPVHPTPLVVASGRDRVVAKPIDPPDTRCERLRYRFTGLGGSQAWCFSLDRLVASGSFSGKLRGSSASVTLTITTRHVWWSGPLWTAFGAAVVAVALVFFTSSRLPSLITALRLRSEKERTGKRVTDLDGWMREARGRMTQGDLLSAVIWMRTDGIAALEATRADLADALERASAIPDGSPLRTAARREAEKTSIDASDLLGTDGKRATSNASQLLGLIERMQADISEWQLEVGRLLPGVSPAHEKEAQQEIQDAQAELATLSARNVEWVKTKLDDVVGQLAVWSDSARPAVQALFGSGVTADVGLREFSDGVEFGRGSLRRLLPLADATAARGLLVVTVILLMAVAAGTALVANYLPNDTFGSFSDYASLAVSVFGSATITGIVGAALAWTKTDDWRP